MITRQRGEIWIGIGLASLSGLFLLAQVFVSIPLSLTAPFVVLPSAVGLITVALVRMRAYVRLDQFHARLGVGARWGLAATLLYDVVRPAIQLLFGSPFAAFRAIPIFGSLITGLPETDPLALAVGVAYHIWNGVSFGMMFALVRPRGGILNGLLWGVALQSLMLATYPRLLQVRLEEPSLLISGLIGHGIWGMTLGYGVRREARHA
jgi:hypothetical protein